MKSSAELRAMLRGIDRKSYPAYKTLGGSYRFPGYILAIDHVQGDPFASPSSVHVEIGMPEAGIPKECVRSACRKKAFQDFLIRQFADQIETYNFRTKGSGKSGLISITRCGQEVLERSACQIIKDRIIVRFSIGFPAFGRTIDGGGLEKILFDFLPKCVEHSFYFRNLNQKKLYEALTLAEDQQAVREWLKTENMAAFVANGSILPRKSGVSDLPMKDSVPFLSPKSMEVTIKLPNRGELSGMAIKQGITLIVGGGYHGKSTLLSALQMGVYDHIAGDGREFVITDDTAVKLRAEEGRSIRKTNISLFINDLPNKKDTVCFSTPDASGSTSQAAGLVEGIEAGSRLFLMDEDTSATNFMVRDDFMQQVISREKEPITPFLERARDLYEKAGISTILVAGSSGAFFYIADQILQMDAYRPVDITSQVKALCSEHQAPRVQAPGFCIPSFEKRCMEPEKRVTRDPRHEHKKVKTFGKDSFSIDKETVDLRLVEQLADSEQTMGLAYLLRYGLEQVIDGKRSVTAVAEILLDTLEQKGWEAFAGAYVPCGLAKPRKQELFACINRYRK